MLPIWMISDPKWPLSELQAYQKELIDEAGRLEKKAEEHRMSRVRPTEYEVEDLRRKTGENKSRLAAVNAALAERGA